MVAPTDPRDAVVRRWGELMSQPSSSIPLDEMALTIAQCARPGLDIVDGMTLLDDLAASCPSPTVESLVRHLFGSGRLRGDTIDYDAPDNSFIDQVVERGVGLPISLCVVAIEVGRRLGVPLHGVGLPGHFLVGSSDDPDVFVDTFSGGRVLDAAGARDVFRRVTGGAAEWDPRWLAAVDTRAIAERMLNNLKASYSRRHDLVGLRWVMRLRIRTSAHLSGESDELRRLMAPTN